MTDIVDARTRSRMMSAIRGRDTKPERIVRSGLHRLGFRFRLSAGDLPGQPDVVLPKWRTVVLVHGCFWHGHEGCRYFRLPATRAGFWEQKIRGNVERDRRTVMQLRDAGWRIAVVWECALRSQPEASLAELADFLRSDNSFLELDAL